MFSLLSSAMETRLIGDLASASDWLCCVCCNCEVWTAGLWESPLCTLARRRCTSPVFLLLLPSDGVLGHKGSEEEAKRFVTFCPLPGATPCALHTCRLSKFRAVSETGAVIYAVLRVQATCYLAKNEPDGAASRAVRAQRITTLVVPKHKVTKGRKQRCTERCCSAFGSAISQTRNLARAV